jgi:hypothetical protein
LPQCDEFNRAGQKVYILGGVSLNDFITHACQPLDLFS